MFGDSLSVEDIFTKVFTENTDSTLLKSLDLRQKEEKNELSLQTDEEEVIEDDENDELLKIALKYL